MEIGLYITSYLVILKMWTEEERLFLEEQYTKRLKEQGLIPDSTPISSPNDMPQYSFNDRSKSETSENYKHQQQQNKS